MTARLALMRHGRTAWNADHRIQGRTDIPLEDSARTDLSHLCLPAPWDRATLWASPLSRAQETAQIVAGRAPVIDDALLEMDWGDWEGQHGVTLKADPESGFRDIEDWGWEYHPPGGESPAELRTRLEPWLEALRGDHVAICHIGVMRVLLAIAWGWNFAGPCPFRVKRNRLFVMERTHAGWQPQPEPVRLMERRP
ncbi:histidine phosphatase family protein [Aliishimia ponticola]|uniref:Histidine phosphatase family protein n=1 Tax=Aliishimia ponticola TaxID=2499833 RepID=A0A4S4N7I1_9RHOB|nr:histidine phosphatase family protein [Aliishimia ponticola]THH35112.1 histidine phosphatase family protein [Aliishimia ponticola]